jgi:crossover junction endodeoxyribonuclease RuvC
MILGVDPGANGAIALFDPAGVAQAWVWDIPVKDEGGVDPFALSEVIEDLMWAPYGRSIKAVVENVHSMPRQAGAFNFGLYTGIVHGVLAAHSIPFELIAPSQWKPAMGLSRGATSGPENKSKSRALATQLFPSLADSFKRVKDDGRAEALLLAVYYANRRK